MGALTVPEVMPLVNALYRRHAAGCCLHVVLDDYNVKDGDLDGLAELALKREHYRCLALVMILRTMSRTQRLKLARGHV